MALRHLNRHRESSIEQTPAIGIPADQATQQATSSGVVERSVYCRHGLHDGHFPVAGLSVREARRTLTQLLNIDPQAVAVINGEIVDDDYVIGEQVTSLNFVKRSSVRGSTSKPRR